MIRCVDDLLTGWQHHIDAIRKALLAKYVMKKSGSLPYCESEKDVNEILEGIDFLGARITAIVIHESCCDIGFEVGQSPKILFVVKTDSQVTLTQLRNESVTTRSRPFASKFNYARDMCRGTSIYPASTKAVFEPRKSQKADGLTKVLAGASMKNLCV